MMKMKKTDGMIMETEELMKMATYGGEAQATKVQINIALQGNQLPTRAMETLQEAGLRMRMEIRKQQQGPQLCFAKKACARWRRQMKDSTAKLR